MVVPYVLLWLVVPAAGPTKVYQGGMYETRAACQAAGTAWAAAVTNGGFGCSEWAGVVTPSTRRVVAIRTKG